MRMRALLSAATLPLILLASCSGPPPPLPTVDGPEDDNLLRKASGHLLVATSDDLLVISLPELTQRPVRHTPSVHAVAGPDRAGRIVYVQDPRSEKKHYVRLASLDGLLDEIVLERPGDAVWDHVIGRDIALSPSGDKVAFVGKHYAPEVGPSDAHTKAGLLDYGELEVWRLGDKTRIETRVKALDRGLEFLAGGNKLVYTALLPRREVAQALGREDVGGGFAGWSFIPAVMVLDLTTLAGEFLHVGWSPVVSPDGTQVLVSDLQREYTLVDLKRRLGRRVTLPGDRGGVAIAFMGEGLVLYWGLPTTGAPQPLVEKRSPLVAARRMETLKVASLGTGRFKTVLAPVDPRWQVSFGRSSRP